MSMNHVEYITHGRMIQTSNDYLHRSSIFTNRNIRRAYMMRAWNRAKEAIETLDYDEATSRGSYDKAEERAVMTAIRGDYLYGDIQCGVKHNIFTSIRVLERCNETTVTRRQTERYKTNSFDEILYKMPRWFVRVYLKEESREESAYHLKMAQLRDPKFQRELRKTKKASRIAKFEKRTEKQIKVALKKLKKMDLTAGCFRGDRRKAALKAAGPMNRPIMLQHPGYSLSQLRSAGVACK